MSVSLFQRFAYEMSVFLRPLQAALSDPIVLARILRRLGAPPPPDSLDIDAISRDLAAATAALLALTSLDPDTAADQLQAAIDAVWTAMDTVTSELQVQLEVNDEEVGQTQAALERVPHWLATTWLEERAAYALVGLRGIGVVGTDAGSDYEVFHPDKLQAFIDDPVAALVSLYQWGDGVQWQFDLVLALLDITLVAVGWVPRWRGVPPEWVANGLIADDHPDFEEISSLRVPLVGLKNAEGRVVHEAGVLIGPVGGTPTGPLDGAFISVWSDFDSPDLEAGGFSFDVPVSLDDPLAGIVFRPTGISTVAALAETLRVSARRLDPVQIADTLTLDDVHASLEIPSSGDDLIVDVGAAIQWTVEIGSGDGFLEGLFGSPYVEGQFSLAYRQATGLTFDLAAGVELVIVPNLPTGPVQVQALTLRAWASSTEVTAHALVNATVDIEVVTFTVVEMGLEVLVPLEHPVAPVVTFVPPTGVGLGIGTDIVSGGGFLFLDPSSGEYAGIVDVSAFGVGITATGLVQVLGSDWSLVVVLAVDLPPIPLGFGFTLTGVGGIFGLDRSLATDEVQSALKTGALDAVLFPDDPIGDAAMILSTIGEIFPVAPGQTLFGPIVEISWGLQIQGQLGVIVELPDPVRISLLGQLSVGLPTVSESLIELNVDVFGTLDLDAGTLAIDAQLRDSNVVGFALSGGMAVRMNWLGEPSFTLAVGGFHPRYPAPPDFPVLDRVGISLDTGGNPQIALDGYLAVTSNSIQFGAHFDFYMKMTLFTIEAYAGFDVLVEFAPFGILVDLELGATVKAGSVTLLGVDLAVSLTGPSPWHVVGSATFKIAGLKTNFDVDVTIGPPADPAPIEAIDASVLVLDALSRTDSWTEVPPAPGSLVTVGSTVEVDPGFVIHPAAQLEIRQSVAPLGEDIERMGNAPISGATRFEVSDVTVSGTSLDSADWPDVEDWFAPGQFFEVSDDERIAGPSFEKMQAGISVGSDTITAGEEVDAPFDYESIVVDPEVEEGLPGQPPVQLPRHELELELLFVQANRSAQAARVPRPAGPGLVSTQTTTWAVVSKTDLTEVAVATTSTSRAGLVAAISREGLDEAQVVPADEVQVP